MKLGAHALRLEMKSKENYTTDSHLRFSSCSLLVGLCKIYRIVDSLKEGSKCKTAQNTINEHGSYIQFVHICYESSKMRTISHMYFVK